MKRNVYNVGLVPQHSGAISWTRYWTDRTTHTCYTFHHGSVSDRYISFHRLSTLPIYFHPAPPRCSSTTSFRHYASQSFAW